MTNQYFAHKNIKYAKYTVRSEDERIYTFTDADLIHLCAYDLPQLHGYLSRMMENKRELGAYLRRVVLVMRKQIKYNSLIDF